MAESKVMAYMQDSNRPFNVQNVADMMAQHGIKKPQVERALVALTERGDVICKEFGKAKIYMLPQNKMPTLSKEELQAQKKANAELSTQVKAAEDRVRDQQKAVAALQSNLTLEAIEAKVEQLKQQVEEAQTKLNGLRQGSVLVSKADREKTEKLFQNNMAHWSKRKRVFNELWDTMSENFDRNHRELLEEIGVETDDSMMTADGKSADYASLSQLLSKKARW